MEWEGLTPPYRTIVADPPWDYPEGWAPFGPTSQGGDQSARRALPYSSMSTAAMAALDVDGLAADDAHLYLWTTNRYLFSAFGLAAEWGFTHSQTLTWCKPRMGIGPGGAFSSTTEFVLFCRRGRLKPSERVDSTWFEFPRRGHSVKPPEFMDIVERVSPAPRVELFARQPRLGWDSWGFGYEEAV